MSNITGATEKRLGMKTLSPAAPNGQVIAYRRDALLIFLLLTFTYGYFLHSIHNANVNSRLGLIFAVVQEGSLNIDSFHDSTNPPTRTIDKSYHDGHYYSDKSLGAAILGVMVYLPLYWLMQVLNVDVTSKVAFDLVRYFITFFTVGLPSAFAGSLLYSLCYLLSQSRRRAYVVMLAIALGTMIFPFSTLLFGHSLAAALLFIGLHDLPIAACVAAFWYRLSVHNRLRSRFCYHG